MSNADNILDEFRKRVVERLLPIYCDDPKRTYSASGFKEASITVTPVDATDFLWALDSELLDDHGGGRYRMPKSHADVTIFWEGLKRKSPRPITLSMEPIITIATMARLHRDFGWPKACLGTESQEWEFDFGAFCPADSDRELIAGEVKKNSIELNALIETLHMFCREAPGEACPKQVKAKNAKKKVGGPTPKPMSDLLGGGAGPDRPRFRGQV